METAEEIELALRREELLHRRAERRRADFAVFRDKALLAILVAIVVFLFIHSVLIPTAIVCSGLTATVLRLVSGRNE